MGISHSLGGVWFDVAGTDDCDYSLAEVSTGPDGFLNIVQYDSNGNVVHSLIGTYAHHDTHISGQILTMGQFNLKLMSPLYVSSTIIIVGTLDASNYRIYIRKPFVYNDEKQLILKTIKESGLSHDALKLDPVLTSLRWDAKREIIIWPM